MPRKPHIRSVPPLVRFALLPVLALLLAACGGATSSAGGGGAASSQQAPAPAMEAPAAATSAPASAAVEEAAVAQQAADTTTESASAAGAPPSQPALGDPNRKIIKNAVLSIEVSSVIGALSRLGSDAAAVGGYVTETRTDYHEGATYAQRATLSLAVPVEQFEPMLQRVREAATQVFSEQASGTDVTEEFVDVQSQIANLEATQARVREFLAQATTVEESLQVNARLSEIEGQLSQLKGRLQYLSQRAAFSTITVELQQVPGPNVEPTPEVVPWSAGETAREAYAALSVIGQSVATVAIWLLVVGLPLVLPVLLVVVLGRVVLGRVVRRSRSAPPMATPESN
jgi:Na+-transporting methylmalonyl-CoA/oxaloacetate decarboxylase gamma subunit